MPEEAPGDTVDKPTLIYDDECPFCRRWADRWKSITGDAIDYISCNSAKGRFPNIPENGFDESVWLVEPDGTTTGAAEAVFRSLSLAGKKRWLLWAYEHVPAFKPVTEAIYRLLSSHRPLADRLDNRFVPLDCDQTRSFIVSGNLLLRAIGLVYLVAFISLRGQVAGLIGSQGILPAQALLDHYHPYLPTRFLQFVNIPTVFWFNCSDAALNLACNVGITCAILLTLGILPVLNSIVLWIAYLSLVSVGQVFLSYQWDALLLEAGLLAIFLSPIGLTLGRQQPSRVVMFLFRWLLLRLMLLSGLVKIASGDSTWHGLAALKFHYQTQPLPTWTSWYMQQQPAWFATISTALVLIIEIAAPLFIFAVRRRRMAALMVLVFLQLLIAATGNYGFFNLLALVLCLTLVDDAAWQRLPIFRKERKPRPRVRWSLWIVTPIAVVLVLLSLLSAELDLDEDARFMPDSLKAIVEDAAAFHVAEQYGLFRVMTTDRPELIIEGSADGVNWLPYEFKYKPGDLNRAPRFCSPGMPRLDWQMWFAAGDPPHNSVMLDELLNRLRHGSKPVIDLFGSNPFPDHPPKYLRLTGYAYRFTTGAERRETGAWWARKRLGELKLEQLAR